MEGCRNPELNPFWTIEPITLKTISTADFCKGCLAAFTAGNFYFLSEEKLTLSEGVVVYVDWNKMKWHLSDEHERFSRKQVVPPTFLQSFLGTRYHTAFSNKVHSY